jgi:hypothetical protein
MSRSTTTTPTPHGDLNHDQLHGFLLACDCFASFGREIEAQGISLGGPQTMVPMTRVMAHGGRMVRNVADLMRLTIGSNIRLAIDASPAPDLLA